MHWWHWRRDLDRNQALLQARITELENELTVIKAKQSIEETLGVMPDSDPIQRPRRMPPPDKIRRHLWVYDGGKPLALVLLAGATSRILTRATVTVAAASAVLVTAGVGTIKPDGPFSHPSQTPTVTAQSPTQVTGAPSPAAYISGGNMPPIFMPTDGAAAQTTTTQADPLPPVTPPNTAAVPTQTPAALTLPAQSSALNTSSGVGATTLSPQQCAAVTPLPVC